VTCFCTLSQRPDTGWILPCLKRKAWCFALQSQYAHHSMRSYTLLVAALRAVGRRSWLLAIMLSWCWHKDGRSNVQGLQ
jgi:hypothetical protein